MFTKSGNRELGDLPRRQAGVKGRSITWPNGFALRAVNKGWTRGCAFDKCFLGWAPQAPASPRMVREHHVAVLLTNHVSVFYIKLYVSGGSYVKYTYMIDREHNHVVLLDHTSISPVPSRALGGGRALCLMYYLPVT